ncbi:hypothetical protein ACWPKO_30345 (plasmid) [Coraliomargarita sp. W4R53]
MLLDRVLAPTDGAKLRSDIGALGMPRSLLVEGVTQDRGGIRQFRFWVDEPGASWAAIFDNGARWSYSAGVVDYGNGNSHPSSFHNSISDPMKMLWPTEYLVWGERPTRFRPVLAQRVGRQSLLLTFEHGSDPAMRQTMVVDQNSGIATKRIEFDHATIITSTTALEDKKRTLESVFEPITDWIHPVY